MITLETPDGLWFIRSRGDVIAVGPAHPMPSYVPNTLPRTIRSIYISGMDLPMAVLDNESNLKKLGVIE